MNKFLKKASVFALLLTAAVCIMFGSPVPAHASSSADFEIKIVHTNDIHARITQSKEVIGMARLKTIIDAWTSGADLDLVLDSGDLFHGQPIATVVQGESVAKTVKACGYDAVTAGNHDWSYGKDRLKELCDMAGVDMLCGNVKTTSGKPFFDTPYNIREVKKNGKTLKVGMFGVIDPSLYTKTTPANVSGLTFTPSAAYAKKAVQELKQQGCNVIIALSHTYAPDRLAAQVDDVDLWLCGHEHLNIDTTVTTPDGDKAYLAESGFYLSGASLIQLDCTFDEAGQLTILPSRTYKTCDDSASYPEDSQVSALLAQIQEEQKSIMEQQVGSTPEALDGDWYQLRIGETNLGRVVTDAYLLTTGADVAFENAGGIRASIQKGTVTYKDIIGVSPYGNYVVTKKLSGKALKDILEHSLDIQVESKKAYDAKDDSAWPENSGSYLQVGGLTAVYDLTKPSGKRIRSIKIQGNVLQENKMYTVAANNYAAESDDYPQLADAEEAGEFNACDEVLVKYFQTEGAVAQSLKNPAMIPYDGSDTDEQTGGEEESTPGKNPQTPENPQSSENETSAGSSPDQSQTESPKTGDDSNLYVALLFLTAVLSSGTAVAAVCRKRR